MPFDVRLLTADDQVSAWLLGSTAFGYREMPMPENWTSDSPGRTTWGVFDDAGRLVAKAVDRQQGHWFGGRIVPASGIAGVAVAAEYRGAGLSRTVLTRLLAEARERGAVISTLFDTTPFPYRSVGFEEVGALTYVAYPATAFAGVRSPADVSLRPAVVEDVPAIQELYRDVARSSAGMMERSAPTVRTTPEQLIADFHGFTVAEIDGVVRGYASWDRGEGYRDATGKVTVYDLVAAVPQAARALLAMLGTWTYVAPTIVLRPAVDDPIFTMIASDAAKIESRQPWMLRVVDLPGAVAARGWPAHLDATLDLTVSDDACPWNEGTWRLTFKGGEGRAERVEAAGVPVTSRGLSALYAGGTTPANLRRAGLLGGDGSTDALLAAVFAGPRPNLLDYF